MAKAGNKPLHKAYFEVHCPVHTSLLRTIRCFVVEVARDMGFSEEDLAQIEMAVDEACSNVALHAYDTPAESEQCIQMRLTMDEQSLNIMIRDEGRGLPCSEHHGVADMEEYLEPERENYHGLGIMIMKQFMDEVDVVGNQGKGTEVRMKKYLAGKGN